MFALFSSVTGGVTTDAALMTVPIDDHIIVRGHAVFDTVTLCNGRLYRLTIHLERLLKSAESARLRLPFGDDPQHNKERMRDAIESACVAADRQDADVRFWLSAGPGNLGVTPAGCTPAFYVLVFGGLPSDPTWTTEGISEVTVPLEEVPVKPKLLAELKSTNYMLNALTSMAARDRGGTFGLAVDNGGMLMEACTLNVVAIGTDGVMRTPPFDNILAGTTVRRAMQLADSLVSSGDLTAVSQEPLALKQAYAAKELFLVAGDTHLYPITRLDGKPIGDGGVGPISRQLMQLLTNDARTGEDCHHDIPALCRK